MPIVRQKWITREDLNANPTKIYVFGDNVERRGYGGQAKEMRGEPNAIGVATKWKPSMAASAFFDDSIECQVIVMRDLNDVQSALNAGKTVVVPEDGIGTGLSRLFATAPKLDAFIKKWFADRERVGLPRRGRGRAVAIPNG
ncbi:DUF7831 domain-containing protein [Bradyrhizobium elkanii]